MIRATKGSNFSISMGLVNSDNSMETGATVDYEIRLHSDDSLSVSGTMTESVNVAGLYYVNPVINVADFYRAYLSSSGFPSVTEDILITEEETKINSYLDASVSGVSGQIVTVQTDLDSPGQYKADVSGLPTLAEIEGSSVLAKETSVSGVAVDIKRLLGLTQENNYIDETTYDSYGNLATGRIRIYSESGSVGTDNDVLATYQITSVGTAANRFSSWKQKRV